MKNQLVIISLISILLLTGCGGKDEPTDPDLNSEKIKNIGKLLYESDNFSLLFPKDWEIIEKDSFTSSVPTETIVGFRNNIKNGVFTTNVNIARRQVEENVNSKDFAKSSLAVAKKNLVNFTQISLEDYKFEYGENGIETFIADYEGKKTFSEAVVHFKALYIVNDNNGYTITGAYLSNEDESVVISVEKIIKSFRFK